MKRGQIHEHGSTPASEAAFRELLESVRVDESEVKPQPEWSTWSVRVCSGVRERAECLARSLTVLPGSIHRTALHIGLRRLEMAAREQKNGS